MNLPQLEDDALLEGTAALQLYWSKILLNVAALEKQGGLLVQAIADQRLLLRDLEPLSSSTAGGLPTCAGGTQISNS